MALVTFILFYMRTDNSGVDAKEPSLSASPGARVPHHRVRGVPPARLRPCAQALRCQLLQIQRQCGQVAGLHQSEGGQRQVRREIWRGVSGRETENGTESGSRFRFKGDERYGGMFERERDGQCDVD